MEFNTGDKELDMMLIRECALGDIAGRNEGYIKGKDYYWNYNREEEEEEFIEYLKDLIVAKNMVKNGATFEEILEATGLEENIFYVNNIEKFVDAVLRDLYRG